MTHIVHKSRAVSVMLMATVGVAFGALIIIAPTPAVAGPDAQAAATCNTPGIDGGYPGSGQGYLTRLRTSGVSCKKGMSVQRSYYKCRLRKGKSGRCTSKVQGYSCRETRGEVIPTEFSASVRCKRGSRKVDFSYSQRT